MIELLMTSPMPMVSNIWFWGKAFRARLMKNFCKKAPNRNITGTVIKIERKGSIWNSEKRKYVAYMPSIKRSPWAKLITRITPKIMVKPMPIRAYTPPINMPLTKA